jgi:hypothetical protein
LFLRVARDLFVMSDIFFGLYLSALGATELIGLHSSPSLFSMIYGVGVMILGAGMFAAAFAVAKALPWQQRLRTLAYLGATLPFAYTNWFFASTRGHWEWSLGDWFVLICLCNLVGYRVWIRYNPIGRA